jgi:GDP-L-fucose synthase
VGDLAEAIYLAFEKYDEAVPVNIGSGEEVRIKDLAELVASKVGYEGSIEWDISKPNGQPRRKLDTTKAKEEFGFEAKTSLSDGLDMMIDWYRSNKI